MDSIVTKAIRRREYTTFGFFIFFFFSVLEASGSIFSTGLTSMDEVALKYPEYGFDSHKGYPTKGHVEALYKYGLIDGYRKTFEPVKSIINGSVYYG